jgi:hypothetical protein
MIAWFANAIMKGYDNGCRVGEENGLEMADRKKEELKRVMEEEKVNAFINDLLDFEKEAQRERNYQYAMALVSK